MLCKVTQTYYHNTIVKIIGVQWICSFVVFEMVCVKMEVGLQPAAIFKGALVQVSD